MAFRSISTTLTLVAAACAAATHSHAQDATQTVVVTGRTAPSAGVAGFDDVPLSRAPFSATVLGADALGAGGIGQLAQAARLEAGVSDAYNSEGYWSNFTIRGFTLDPRANYRRDGLPINAETALWLGNKQALEVLKGASGLQAGTSVPGGLVNLLVKRPQAGRVRSATLDVQGAGTVGAAVDLGDRAGDGGPVGWRLNASHERLDPMLRDARGSRSGVAAAFDWRLAPGRLLEAEFEVNRQSQASQAAFSLLGGAVPDAHAIDPRLNLNNQPWSLPVVFDGRTASLRYTQLLAADLQLKAHAMTQRLRTDDRIAFPFGCSAEGAFDRYCSDGSFDFYDFRSEGERRRSDALDVGVSGNLAAHRYAIGVLAAWQRTINPLQAFNFVGTGTIDGLSMVPADPTLTTPNADRRERSLELYLRDRWMLAPRWSLWLGARHTQLHRSSDPKDGNPSTTYEQTFTTPWLALSHRVSDALTAYVSWGQGIESTVVPNLPTYQNPGQALPALKSRQLEAGLKAEGRDVDWSVAAFDISRPATTDAGTPLLSRTIDGEQRHRGIEAAAAWRSGAWSLQGSATALRARREGAADPAMNGQRPPNVPEHSVRAQVSYQLPQLPGARLGAALTHEGSRTVLPDNNSPTIGAWTRVDLSLRIEQRLADATTLTWQLGVDNVADRRAWKEAPLQFDHAFLFPLAPRTWRAGVQAAF